MPRPQQTPHTSVFTLLVDREGHPLPHEDKRFPQEVSFWENLSPSAAAPIKATFTSFAQSAEQQAELSFHNFLDTKEQLIRIERVPGSSSIKITFPLPPEQNAESEGRYRKRYKAILKKLDLLMSSTQQVCWDWDLSTDKVQLLGPQDCILGYQYSDIQNITNFWIQKIHPEDAKRVKESLEEVRAGNKSYWEIEYRSRDAQGNYPWIKHIGVVETSNDLGQPNSMIGTTQLIDAKKQAEQERCLNLERYRAIVDSQGDSIVRIDLNGRILFKNTSFSKRFIPNIAQDTNIELEEAITQAPALAPFRDIIRRAATQEIEEPFMTGNEGDNRNLHLWNARRIETENKDVLEVQFSGRDLSQIKSLEEALVTSNRQNQAKDRFLAMISHDLRTPLNPILGFAELIAKRTADNPDLHKMANNISSAGKQLLGHINSLLEISKMDAELHFKEYDHVTLSSLRDHFESTFTLKAEQKSIAFAVSLSGPRDQEVVIDLKLLQNTLNNLVDNAIKFTPEGSVLLQLALEPHVAGQDRKLAFKVVDEGPGIPSDSLDRIFEPFVRLDDTNSRETEGAGLGLSICKRAIELLNGELTATPNRRVGMTFSGWVPVETAQQASLLPESEPHESATPLSQLKTLIVDDIESNRIVLSEILNEFQLTADTCSDGHSALERIATENYDIVFMDIHMPKLSGIETMEQAEGLNLGANRPYFVAVTADVTPHNKHACTKVGINDLITKPISRAKLNRVLSDFQQQRDSIY